MDTAKRLEGGLRYAASYPTGAVCHTDADTAVAALRQKLAAFRGSEGAVLVNVVANPLAPDQANRGLQPIAISLEMNASYASVTGLLDKLSQATPMVFVDTLDLKPSGDVVSLKLSGRLFCSPAGL
jgi:hypothetical protein